jgi:hemerythrin superfamily protein
MATATQTGAGKTTRKTTSARKATSSRAKDAIAVLKDQHREVEKLFGQFKKARGEDRQAKLCEQICTELKIHTRIEEELLYPRAHDELSDASLVDEAYVEHNAAKDLIGEIEQTDPGDEMFEARMQVLEEQIRHHVKEEEGELFPKIRKTDMDLKAIGEALQQRTKELRSEMGGDGRGVH